MRRVRARKEGQKGEARQRDPCGHSFTSFSPYANVCTNIGVRGSGREKGTRGFTNDKPRREDETDERRSFQTSTTVSDLIWHVGSSGSIGDQEK